MIERIDALFASFGVPGSPGCALGVIRDGRLAYARGYGLANLEHGIPITPSTPFYVASMAKQFTGLAIALLATEGRLDLDADVRTYLPYVPDFGHVVTSRHLLHHTSGLRSDLFLLIAGGWRIEDVIIQQDLLDLVSDQRELDFAPGEEFSYCGTGYGLLAEIVTAVSGRPFPEFCRNRIFEPLGMIQTRFETDPFALVPGRANAYLALGEGRFENAVQTIGLVGGTGLYTSIEDLVRWNKNFATGRIGGSRALTMMQTPGRLDSGKPVGYGFGLEIATHRGRRVIGHGGDSVGIHCYMIRLPEERLSVAVLGNVSDVRASALAERVIGIVLEIDADVAEGAPTASARRVEVSAEILEKRAGRYYDARSGAFLDLISRDDQLTLYGYELTAASADTFSIAGHPEVRVIFEDDAGRSRRVSVDLGSGAATYEQVEVVDPPTQELADYAGDYHSEEVHVTWRIALERDRLVVHRRRQGASRLSPICRDVFTDPWVGEILHGRAQWVIAFDRTEGDICGLRLSAAGGRGRNLRFEKRI